MADGALDLDRFYDEAFPNDPYLSGVMRAEIDRMRGERRAERPEWWMDHLGEWHEGKPPWDRCPHGIVGGDVWCHHCDGEPF